MGRVVLFWTILPLFGSQPTTTSRLVFPHWQNMWFKSKTFLFLVVDSRTRNSFRRVSLSFISVYNSSKFFQPDGPLLLAINIRMSLPRENLTSVSLLDSSIPFSLAYFEILGGLHVKEIDSQFVEFLQTVSKRLFIHVLSMMRTYI